jgi:hypothetical protein
MNQYEKLMKKSKLAIAAAVALALVATEQAARASLTTAASGSGDLVFGNPVSSEIPVNYDVVFNSATSLYTYLYSFTPIPGDNIGQFTINGQYVSSVLASGTSFSGSAYTLNGTITDSGTALGNVSWVWSPYTSQEQFIGFTSLFGPTAGTGSLNDDTTGPWGDNPGSGGTSVVVPGVVSAVPEASTVISAALLFVPFGAGFVRQLRKNRGA